MKIAAVQMASGPNVGANLIETKRLIELAVSAGARLIVLPENFAHMGLKEEDIFKIKEQPGSGKIQEFLSQQARSHKIWLVGGSVPLSCANPHKVRAACIVYDDKGKAVSRYDKIHLFDVHIQETGEKYTESMTIEAGETAVLISTPFGKLGLGICYDLRFPELFRELMSQGMEILAIPSAFTAITGKAHWEALVRARAIENLCYVVAAAQGGYHLNGRETHGDSMIVDPWGIVLDRLPRGSGMVVADFDRGRLLSIRRNFPAIDHARLNHGLNQQVAS